LVGGLAQSASNSGRYVGRCVRLRLGHPMDPLEQAL